MRDESGVYYLPTPEMAYEDYSRSTPRESFFHNFLVPLVDLLRPDDVIKRVDREPTRRLSQREYRVAPEQESFLHNFLVPLVDLLRADHEPYRARQQVARQVGKFPDTVIGFDKYTN